jgi:probable F420-dependent oxidoreductase
MRVGISVLGWGGGSSEAGWVSDSAQIAEHCGFSTIWAGEHFLFFDEQTSVYPYMDKGSSGAHPLPKTTELLDPFVALTWAGAATSTIRLAVGVALLPLRNPVVLAKQVASIDHLTEGRFVLGVGIGWLEQEYDAVGVPVERRVTRLEEYITVMRRLWEQESSTFDGEFIRFQGALCYPKPRYGTVPVYFGGMTDPVLRRTARIGDGILAVGLEPGDAADYVTRLQTFASEKGRDTATIQISVLLPRRHTYSVDDLKRYADAGIDEIVVRIPYGMCQASQGPRSWIEQSARDFVERVAALETS